MFDFDIFNNPKPHDLYLCRPDGSIVCYLNGIDEQSASLTVNLNNQLELNFNYNKYIIHNGEKILSNGFNNIAFGMKILVDRIGLFKMKYPPMNFDGEKTTLSVSATSIDSELEDKDLVNFKINTGEPDSLEYLVTYDAGETESLINEYTGLPYDYIVFYNTFPEQLRKILNKYGNNTTITNSASIKEIVEYCTLIPRLKNKVNVATNGTMSVTEYVSYTYNSAGTQITSIYLSSSFNSRISTLINFYTKYRKQLSLIDLAIEKCNCNWKVGEIDPKLYNRKFQFDINSSNIYTFLTQDIAQASECVVMFDIFKSEINIVSVDTIGEESDVIIDRKNLLNTIDVTCDENGICTRFNVSGGNDIGIQYVNFGSSRIDDISYFLNARNENNELIYVSESLASKYRQFIEDRNIARPKYMEYTKAYNQSLISIDELKYRVPNDEVQNDWDTFSTQELEASLTVYNNLLVTLISLYKEDFGSVGCNSDGSVKESYIKTTMYWHDYYAYNVALEQIRATIVARANGSSYKEISDAETLAKINAWKTEWSLFGIVELQNKVNAYSNNMTVLVDGQAVVLKSNSQQAKRWSELTNTEKAEYGNFEVNYQYDIYMQNYNERSSCQTYLNSLMSQLTTMERSRDNYQSLRSQLVKLVTVEGYDRAALGRLVTLPSSSVSGKFTETEIKTINLFYIDRDYSNKNILTTSLDNTVSEVDVQYELLQDAEERLSVESQPQISFNTDIDNLLCMPEFKDYKFRVGNYVVVEYHDNYYVKLRLASIQFNPLIPTNSISVSFTNYIRSRSERSDLSYILGLATGGSNGSSSSGGSGSGSGSFGDSDKIDVTISNTMLAKLLNTEMFGTRVSNIILDTIKVNQITAKYAKFDGLAKGTTTIDGQCIKTGVIVSNNYNGTKNTTSTGVTTFATDNTLGSILKLSDGTFNLAGGKLTYNGTTLNVKAHFNAESISTGNKVSANTKSDGLYVDSNGNLYIGSSNTTQINKDGTGHIGAWYFNATQFYNNTITNNSDGFIGLATADFARTINGTSRNLRFAIGSKFGVTKEGNIYAGNITVDAGYIGGSSGFVIASGKLYSNGHSAYNTAADGVYLGTDYISLGSGGATYFKNDGSAKIGAFTITKNGAFYTNGHSAYNSGVAGVYLGSDYISLGNGGVTYFKNDGTGKIGAWTFTGTEFYNGTAGNAGSIKLATANFNVTINSTSRAVRMSVGSKFGVASDGTIYAIGAVLSGTITAGSGSTFGAWTISDSCIWRGSASYGVSGAMYFGISGLSLGSDFKVSSAGVLTCSKANLSGSIIATSFTYSDSEFTCTVSDGFEIVNKTEWVSTSYAIRGKGGSMTLFEDGIDFYTGTNFNGTVGSIWHDSQCFHFSRAIDIGTTSIRAGDDANATICDCNSAGKFYFGSSSAYVDESALTVLRGKTVRIYHHSGGGVYLGSSGSTAITSDENLKDIFDIDNKYVDFFNRLNPIAYKYKVGHRTHMGFGARAVENALVESGLETEDFAGIIIQKDVDIGADEIMSPDGATHFDELYSLRYEEFIALNTMMIKVAFKKIADLEQEIKKLKGQSVK